VSDGDYAYASPRCLGPPDPPGGTFRMSGVSGRGVRRRGERRKRKDDCAYVPGETDCVISSPYSTKLCLDATGVGEVDGRSRRMGVIKGWSKRQRGGRESGT
jgi:hypothetical protein